MFVVGICTLNTFGDVWPGIWWTEDMNIATGIASNHRCIKIFDSVSILSCPLHPTPALVTLSIQLALHSSGNPQLSTAPHSIHLTSARGCKPWHKVKLTEFWKLLLSNYWILSGRLRFGHSATSCHSMSPRLKPHPSHAWWAECWNCVGKISFDYFLIIVSHLTGFLVATFARCVGVQPEFIKRFNISGQSSTCMGCHKEA